MKEYADLWIELRHQCQKVIGHGFYIKFITIIKYNYTIINFYSKVMQRVSQINSVA